MKLKHEHTKKITNIKTKQNVFHIRTNYTGIWRNNVRLTAVSRHLSLANSSHLTVKVSDQSSLGKSEVEKKNP